jgi:epoxyqueuosine reductase QueG
MYNSEITGILKEILVPEEEFVFGFSDMKGLIEEKFPGFRYAISIGKKLNDKVVENLVDGPTLEYFNHYKQVNMDLTELSARIQSELTASGIESISVKPTIRLKEETQYLENLSYDISHKMVATRAGLGWIGKTDLLISFKFGPRLRLTSILLREDPGVNSEPVERSFCGTCKTCVVKCPAKAATGKSWNIRVHRDEFFDPFKCREMCAELARRKLNVAEHICGLCVSICPGKGSLRKKIRPQQTGPPVQD